jgi:hypothetical protein
MTLNNNNPVRVPEISRLSPFNPEETLQVFGENLQDCQVFLWLPPKQSEGELQSGFMFEGIPAFPEEPPADAIELKIINEFDQVLYVQAGGYDQVGCGLIWLKNAVGYSKAAVANKPDVWNQSLISAMPGDRISFYGRNFFYSDLIPFRDKKCYIQHNDTNKIYPLLWGSSQDIQQFMPQQNDHKCEFILPSDLPSGKYLVMMHNGTGGRWGWTNCHELEIQKERTLTEYLRLKWSYESRNAVSFDISRTERYAVPVEYGDGITDVTDILQQAIDKIANAGGGIVTLPAGRFGLSRTLEIKPCVVLKGAGMGATSISVAEGKTLTPYIPDVPYAARINNAKSWAIDWKPFIEMDNNTPLIWVQTNAGMEDLKVEGGSGAVMLVFIATADGKPSEGVFFNSVEFDNTIRSPLSIKGEFRSTNHGILSVCHTNDFTMYKCRVKATFPLSVLPAKCNRMRLIANDFEVSPRQNSDNVFICGVYDAIIAENTMRYGRRTMMCQQGFSNNWVFQNRSEGVANCTNANEEYMSEYGYSAWTGHIISTDDTGVELEQSLDDRVLTHGGGTIKDNLHEHRWILFIMKGRGLGQYRSVTGISGNKIYIDRPWDVLPDESTFFNLVTVTEHNMWINNYSGMGSGNSQFIWLAGVENIIAGHQMLLSAGISLYATMLEEDEKGEITDLGILAFNQVIGCDSRYSGTGILLWTNYNYTWWSDISDMPYKYTNILGNIMRWNSIVGGSDANYMKNQSVWLQVEKISGIQMYGDYNLAEKNLIAGFPIGIHVQTSSRGNLIHNNSIEQTDDPIFDNGNETYKSINNILS